MKRPIETTVTMFSLCDTRVPYSSFKKVSAAAQSREDHAKVLFDSVKKDFEDANDDTSMDIGDTYTIELLQASHHLTKDTWRSFRKYVLNYDGWSTKRRVATEEEKKASGETRKGPVYFTSVSFTKYKSPREQDDALHVTKRLKISGEEESVLADLTNTTSTAV